MNKQFGFTLTECAVALVLVAIVATGATSAVFYTFKSANKVNALLPAFNNMQIAGKWLSRDVQTASRTNLVDGAAPVSPDVTPVSIYRTDYYTDPPVNHTITYTLSGDELIRNLDGQISTIARNISSVTFARTTRTITIDINSNGQVRTYKIYMRSG